MTAPLLYLQLQSRPYPKQQFLDQESVNWLREHAKPQPVSVHDLTPAFRPLPADWLELQGDWFLQEDSAFGIHGIRHLWRVAVFAWVLLQMYYPSMFADDTVHDFIWAAHLHDIRRQDDNADPEHGERTADWIIEQFPSLSPDVVTAVRLHVADQLTDLLSDDTLIFTQVLKTADALDRYRLPKKKWWPDPNRLPLAVSNDVIEFCKFITICTEQLATGSRQFEELINEIRQWLIQAQLI